MVNQHYQNRYDRFIAHYKSNLTEGYCERHHIVPKCLGGTNQSDNLVLLPARAHIIAHELLMKAHPRSRSLKHAFAQMCVNSPNSHRRYSSRQYELGRIARSEAMKGVAMPEWVREKLRVKKAYTGNYKKPKTKGHAAAISRALIGIKRTPEHIANLAESRSRNMKARTAIKREKLRADFIASGLSRREFAKQVGIHYVTVKRYLRGIPACPPVV